MKILAIHQGAELYGSDRSFALSVNTFLKLSPQTLDIHLPEKGELETLFDKGFSKVSYHSDGILRKYSLKKNPFSTIFGLIKSFVFYIEVLKKYDIIYINTIVCVSAILASIFVRNQKIYVHVREIPTGVFGTVFRILLKLSSANIIFNSLATKVFFNMKGVVVHNAFEPKAYQRVTFSTGDLPVKFLIIGRINNWKGQDFVLKSIKENSSASKLEINILGNVFQDQKYLIDYLVQLSKELECKINFEGFVKDPTQYFANTLFTIVPSLKPEPFGRVAIESLAYGRPVVAAKHGGLCEIIEDGKNGFFFEPGNKDSFNIAINKCLKLTQKDYEQMCTESIRIFQEKFSVSKYEQNLKLVMDL